MKHVHSVHYLNSEEELRDARAGTKAHWDNWEKKKGKQHAMESQGQRQGRLDACAEALKTQECCKGHYVTNVARLRAVDILHSYLGTRPRYVNFKRKS